MKLLARIGIDPGLIPVRWFRAGMYVAPHLRIDPEAGKQRPEHDFVRLRIGRREKVGNVMVTRWRERGFSEELRRALSQ
jgi:hypothetical protein